MTKKKDTSEELKKFCSILYTLYALGILLQFRKETILLSVILMISALILNYMKQRSVKDKIFSSHLQWMLRTFWIGTGVYMPIVCIIAGFILFNFTNIGKMQLAISSPDSLIAAIETYMTLHFPIIKAIVFLSMIPLIIWWIKRCWDGHRLVQKGKPIQKIKTWLW